MHKGGFTPTSDEVERKLANLRKSLSAIFGRIYSSKPRKWDKKGKKSKVNQNDAKPLLSLSVKWPTVGKKGLKCK